MTNQEILTKAIHKAIDGGWNGVVADRVSSIADEDIDLLFDAWPLTAAQRNIYNLTPLSFIFNHDFAKALWGIYPLICHACLRHHDSTSDCDAGFAFDDLEYWQYHLQQMVIAEDPIKYLGEHING